MRGWTRSIKLFCVGFLGAFLSLVGVGSFAPVGAGHTNGTCFSVNWSELTKENKNLVEDGNKGDIKVNYPDGGPEDGITRAVMAWSNNDNYGEVGWNWHVGSHSSPRRFWAREDGGVYGQDANAGDGGTRGNYHDYKIDNTTGTTWVAIKDSNQYHTYTFNSMDRGRPLTLTEVDVKCDPSDSYFRNLRNAQTNFADYEPWSDQREAGIGADNPCYVTDILSNTALDVNHSSC